MEVMTLPSTEAEALVSLLTLRWEQPDTWHAAVTPARTQLRACSLLGRAGDVSRGSASFQESTRGRGVQGETEPAVVESSRGSSGLQVVSSLTSAPHSAPAVAGAPSESAGHSAEERAVSREANGKETQSARTYILSNDDDDVRCKNALSPVDDLPIPNDVLSRVFLMLQPTELARAAQVSRRWRAVAQSPGLRLEVFRRQWGLARAAGAPSRPSFWAPKAPSFVLSHRLRPTDTVTSVAVQYGCQALAIRRTNNMMSDHAIYTRSRLLIPLSSDVVQRLNKSEERTAAPIQRGQPRAVRATASLETQTPHSEAYAHASSTPGCQALERHGEGTGGEGEPMLLQGWLQGKFCRIEFDSAAKRDVAVVCEHEEELQWDCTETLCIQRAADALRGDAAKRAEARSRVAKMLVRAFGVDEATAAFYIEEAGGDVRAASQELRSDLQWERSNKQWRRGR